MTAYQNYDRLEAMGLWREHDGDQRIEVVLSLGETTLLMTDMRNNPLTHWSLAAIEPIGKTDRGIVYSVDPEGQETIEVHDSMMIKALSSVHDTVQASRPHPGRLRRYASLGLLAIAVLLLVFWFPNRVYRYAANIMPEEKARFVGEQLISLIEQTTGPTCESTTGIQALAVLVERLKLTPTHSLRVMELGARPTIQLPGHITLINGDLLRAVDDPAIPAGYILSSYAQDSELGGGNLALFKSLGLRKTLAFLATGDIADSDLTHYANSLLFTALPPASVKDHQIVFAIAQVPLTPFAIHAERADLLIDGELVGADEPILRDDQMVSLQSICLG